MRWDVNLFVCCANKLRSFRSRCAHAGFPASFFYSTGGVPMRYLLARLDWSYCALALFTLFILAANGIAQEPTSPGLTEPAAAAEPAPAAPAPPTNAELKIMADTVWVLVTGMLVFFMN